MTRAEPRSRSAAVSLGAAVALLLARPAMAAFLAESPAEREAFGALLERWHDFYLLSGTAAVTLAGLLFVALSIHVDQLVHSSREHLLRLSRGTLSSFIMVLALSLVFLTPGLSARIMGVELIVFGSIFTGFWTFQTLKRSAEEDPRLRAHHMRRSFRIPLVGYLFTIAVGASVLARNYDALTWMVGVMCLLLGSAAGTSWELLVRVARARRDAESDREDAIDPR